MSQWPVRGSIRQDNNNNSLYCENLRITILTLFNNRQRNQPLHTKFSLHTVQGKWYDERRG